LVASSFCGKQLKRTDEMILAHADIELRSTSDKGGRMTRRRTVNSK
jgi:hypothetical protein